MVTDKRTWGLTNQPLVTNKFPIMNNKDILFSIINKMSFNETFRFGQVNRMIYDILNTEEYWSHRARSSGLDGLDGLNGVFEILDIKNPDPKIRYAWTIVSDGQNDQNDQNESRDFRHAVVYLSERKDLLFPGLELLIGLNEFIQRAVRQNNLELTKYVVSLGIPSWMIDEAGQLAVELNFKIIAEFLCSVFSSGRCIIDFNVRYSQVDDSNLTIIDDRYITALVKYGKYDPERHPYKPVPYLCGLADKYATSGILDRLHIEEEFIKKLKEECWTFFGIRLKVLDNFRDIGEHLSRGSTKMIDAFISRGISVYWLVRAVMREDNVPLMRHIMEHTKVNNTPYGAMIRSPEMYDLFKEQLRSRTADEIFNMILIGGNYRLFYRMCERGIGIGIDVDTLENVLNIDHVCPVMLIEIIKKRGISIISSPKRLMDLVKHPICPYFYDLLRSHGFPKDLRIVNIGEHTQIDRYPHLLADLTG